jgi:hypothetical protein
MLLRLASFCLTYYINTTRSHKKAQACEKKRSYADIHRCEQKPRLATSCVWAMSLESWSFERQTAVFVVDSTVKTQKEV